MACALCPGALPSASCWRCQHEALGFGTTAWKRWCMEAWVCDAEGVTHVAKLHNRLLFQPLHHIRQKQCKAVLMPDGAARPVASLGPPSWCRLGRSLSLPPIAG